MMDLTAKQVVHEAEEARWHTPSAFWPAIDRATRALPAPVAVLHGAAFAHNAHEVVERARRGATARSSVPTVRIGSKSVRCLEAMRAVLRLDGYRGVFGFTLAEALWLVSRGFDDVVVGYPTVDRNALEALFENADACRAITLMIDSENHLDLIDSVRTPRSRPSIRICIDIDMSLEMRARIPRIGVWRSALRTADAVRDLAERVASRPGFQLVGLLGYEAQIAGVADMPANRMRGVVLRRLQQISRSDVARRRGEAVRAVRDIADLEFVNGGGSGSIESTAADPSVTEVTVGSALTGPHLFDSYRAFRPAPATAFGLDVVRVPSEHRATLLGGGWVASGPPAKDRLPIVVWPTGCRFEGLEAAGEVQTPLRTEACTTGDRVWLRHAKGGELAEHVNEYQVIENGEVVGAVPTYRGEGKAFL